MFTSLVSFWFVLFDRNKKVDEQITYRESGITLFTNRSPDTRLQLVTRDHDLITTS
jgi:hypothetical protein